MRILVASDLHGDIDSLRFIMRKAHETGPDMLLFLGDMIYHGPRNQLPGAYDTRLMLKEIPADMATLPCPLQCVRGNCDAEVDVDQMPFAMPEDAWLDADGLRIFACHGHRLPDNPPIPGLPAGTVLLRGHTHVPRGETIDGLHFWNPGSLSLPKGGFPRSYGYYEDGLFRVLDMQDREILRHCPAEN